MKRKTKVTTTFHVSPLGNDRWSGTLGNPAGDRSDGPFATLVRARDAIRNLNARPRKGWIRVLVRGGVYQLAEPLLLGPEDSGKEGAQISYEAYRDEVPVLDAGRSITGWKKVEEPVDGLTRKVQRKVWVARIPKRWHFKQLFFNGRSLPRSCSEKDDDWHTWRTGRLGKSQLELLVKPSTLKGIGDCSYADVSCLTTPYTYWANAITPITSVDERKGRLGFAAMWVHRPEVLKDIPYRIENMLSGIQREGQWFLNDCTGELYLWPPGEADPNGVTVTAPYLEEAVAITGDDRKKQWVHHVLLRGLHVVHTNLAPYVASPNRSAFGSGNSAIHMAALEDCRIERCQVYHVNGNAISASGHVQRVTVSGCEIRECGAAGITFSGSLAAPEASCGNNRISDNRVHHCGTQYMHSVGISAGMSERSVISHNHVHHMPYAGITTSGVRHLQFVNWPKPSAELEAIWKRLGKGQAPTVANIKKLIPGHNRIERNLIHHVMLTLDDGAAVYCHAGHHNRVSHNLVHHTGSNGSHGLYFDDEEMDSTMVHNLVYESPINIYAERGSALHVHNNARNTVRNNIFVGGNRLFTFPNSYGGHRIVGNIFVFGDGHAIPVTPEAIIGPGDGRRQPDWSAGPSEMDGNLFWSKKGAKPAKEFLAWWQKKGFGINSNVGDPLFRNMEKGDYRLKVRSPGYKFGIKPFDFEAVGPRH